MAQHNYLTVSDLQRLTGEPHHRVRYALERHGIAPADKIGNARVWSRDDFPRIALALSETAAKGRNRAEGRS